MTSPSRLDDLLDAWHVDRQSGRNRSVAELCADCPELTAEVERRIAILSQFEQLADIESVDTHAPHGEADTAVTNGLFDETEPSPLPALPGPLGDFVPIQLLGHGGMGAVFLAEDRKLHRQVALKVMRPDLAADPAARQRFLREARAMAAVEHEHIITIHAVGEGGATPFLVMPVLKGETLENRLRLSERFSLTEACRIGREVATGLAAAHAVGLIHRDIKPGNIWLDGTRSKVKILDFGLARAIEGQDITQSRAVLGTPAYMSPEQGSGIAASPRSDLFSLGAVLYRMTTGTQPFAGDTLMATLSNLANRQPPLAHTLNPDVPRELSQLIDSLLAKDPDRRPASAADVASTLEQIETTLRQQAASPKSPPAVTADAGRRQPPQQNRRWTWAGFAGAAALLAAVIIITIQHKDGSQSSVKVNGAADVSVEAAPGSTVRVTEQDPATSEPDGRNAATTPAGTSISPAVNVENRATTLTPIPVGESPLDALDPNQIPPEERMSWQPPELVAVVGKHKLRQWGPIHSIAISPTGDLVVTASAHDATLRLWNTVTGEELAAFQDAAFTQIPFLAFSPDGRFLACHSAYSNVTLLYEVTQLSIRERARLTGGFVSGDFDGNPFSSDSRSIVLNSPGTDVFQSWNLTTEPPTPATAHQLELTTDPALMHLLGDGQRMLLLNWDRAAELPIASLWQLTEGKATELSRLRPETARMVVSPDGKWLAMQTAEGTSIRRFSIESGRFEEQAPLASGDGASLSIERFSGDSSALFYTSAGRLLSCSVKDGNVSATTVSTGISGVERVSFARHRRLMACVDGQSNRCGLQVYEGDSGGHWTLRLRDEPSWGISLSSDRTQMFTGHGDTRRWDLRQAAFTPVVVPQSSSIVSPFAFDVFPDGRIVGGVRTPEWGVGVIDPARGNGADPQLVPGGPYINLKSARVSHDGSVLALSGHTCALTVVDLTDATPRVRAALGPGPELGLMVALSPDGSRMTSYHWDYGRLRLWDLRSPQPRLMKLWEGVTAHNFANDQPMLALGMADGKVRLVDISGDEPRETLTLQASTAGVSGVVVFHGGKTALVADALGALRFLALPDGTATREWKWPGATELHLAFDGRHVIALNRNDTAYVLRLTDPSGPGSTVKVSEQDPAASAAAGSTATTSAAAESTPSSIP